MYGGRTCTIDTRPIRYFYLKYFWNSPRSLFKFNICIRSYSWQISIFLPVATEPDGDLFLSITPAWGLVCVFFFVSTIQNPRQRLALAFVKQSQTWNFNWGPLMSARAFGRFVWPNASESESGLCERNLKGSVLGQKPAFLASSFLFFWVTSQLIL